MRWLGLVLLVGCYHPAEVPGCEVRCAPDRTCPPGTVCDNNGACKPEAQEADCTDVPKPIDAPLSEMAACTDQSFLKICLDPPPTNVLFLTGMLDTDDDTKCTLIQPQSNGPDVCVIAAGRITIADGQTFRAFGLRPIALLGLEAIDVHGTIDVSSRHDDLLRLGAGSGTGACDMAGTSGSNTVGTSDGAGGGAGASFKSTSGGMGGRGQMAAGGKSTGPGASIARLRGGCRGGTGGHRNTGGTAGAGEGGAGGGALYLFTRGVLAMTSGAKINASGAGATNATAVRCGGGGGGSGGFIVLEAQMFSISPTAQIFAIGGSGSTGAGAGLGGAFGVEATGPMDTAVSAGGGGGNGGAGAVIDGQNGDNGVAPGAAGGGGGGGGGVIGFRGGSWTPSTNVKPIPVQIL